MKPTERFTEHARDYAAGRPSYPHAAIDVVFEGLGDPSALAVVDLGAGTGISSRLLAGRGAGVIAVEPNSAMREQAAPHPNLTWQPATAERTGLRAASAHLVTAFQAFHWFDSAAVLREIARLLRPAGRAAVIYNERDESDPFTTEYGALVHRYAGDGTERRRSDGRAFRAWPAWYEVRIAEIGNTHALDRAGVHARAGSTSYLPKEGAGAVALHTAIDALFDRHAIEGTVKMRMTTSVTVADTARRR